MKKNRIPAILLGSALFAASIAGVAAPASAAEAGVYALTVKAVTESTVTVDVAVSGGVELVPGGSTGAELVNDGSGLGSLELPSTASLGSGASASGTWRVVDDHTAVFSYSVSDKTRKFPDAAWGHCVSRSGVGGAAAGAFAGAFTGPRIIAAAALGSMTGLIAGAITCS